MRKQPPFIYALICISIGCIFGTFILYQKGSSMCDVPSTGTNIILPTSVQCPSIVMFSSDRCGWCKKQEPILQEISKETGIPLTVMKCVDTNLDEQLGISGVPVTVVVGPDGKIVGRFDGYSEKSGILEVVQTMTTTSIETKKL